MTEYKLQEENHDMQESINNWYERIVNEFLYVCKNHLVKEERFMDEIAASIAWSHFENEDCSSIYKFFNLSQKHSICYLHSITNSYQEELELEFLNYIDDLKESTCKY